MAAGKISWNSDENSCTLDLFMAMQFSFARRNIFPLLIETFNKCIQIVVGCTFFRDYLPESSKRSQQAAVGWEQKKFIVICQAARSAKTRRQNPRDGGILRENLPNLHMMKRWKNGSTMMWQHRKKVYESSCSLFTSIHLEIKYLNRRRQKMPDRCLP